MSTDHQKYSTENQLDVIRSYAVARGLQILRVFEDSGRSGLLRAYRLIGYEPDRDYSYIEVNRALRQA